MKHRENGLANGIIRPRYVSCNFFSVSASSTTVAEKSRYASYRVATVPSTVMAPVPAARAIPGNIAKESIATVTIVAIANKRRQSLLTATTSTLIAMATSMHPCRSKTQHRSTS